MALDFLSWRLGNVGWTVYLLKCANGAYSSGMTRDLSKKLEDIHGFKDRFYFNRHPELLPVVVVYKEERLSFREAYAKALRLREMNRRGREKLLKTGKWEMGGALLDYIITTPIENLRS